MSACRVGCWGWAASPADSCRGRGLRSQELAGGQGRLRLEAKRQFCFVGEEIEITFSYWDGSGHRRTVKVGGGEHAQPPPWAPPPPQGPASLGFSGKELSVLTSEFHRLFPVGGPRGAWRDRAKGLSLVGGSLGLLGPRQGPLGHCLLKSSSPGFCLVLPTPCSCGCSFPGRSSR